MNDIKLLVLALMSYLFMAPIQAAVVIDYAPGNINYVDGLSTFDTSGASMDGMRVTAVFGDGSSDVLFWADTNIISGGVFGADWSLSYSGSTTFRDGWTLDYSGGSYLDSVFIDAGLGNAVFDVIDTTGLGSTTDSARGRPFELTSGASGVDIAATYSNSVALSGTEPVGDLYRNLMLNFSSSSGGFVGGMTFRADTDNVTGQIVSVSEPKALILLIVALACWFCGRLGRNGFHVDVVKI